MKTLRSFVLILISGIAAGFLLMLAVSLIPSSMMIDECYESVEDFNESIVRKDPVSGHAQDNFTDALMLLEAAYDGGEGLIDRAVGGYVKCTPSYSDAFSDTEGLRFFGTENVEPVNTFRDLFIYEKPGTSFSYSRYWHGYLVFLRPLFCVFNYRQILLINTVLQAALLLAVLVLMYLRRRRALIPFLAAVMLLSPTSIAISLQFSTVYYITLAELLLLLWNPRGIITHARQPYFFLLSGMITVYMDFLTYPAVSLLMPVCLICEGTYSEKGFAGNLSHIIFLCFCWLFGYAGMWAGKWFIAWLVQGREFLQYLFAAVSQRSSTDIVDTVNMVVVEKVTRGGTLMRNLGELFNRPSAVIAPALAALGELSALAFCRRRYAPDMKRILSLFVPFTASVAWILLLCNHSYMHYWFTFRTLAPAVFALLLMFMPVKRAVRRST